MKKTAKKAKTMLKRKIKEFSPKLTSFNFSYDAEANASYLKYGDFPVAKTVAIDKNTNADFDAKGNLIGIEHLNIY